MIMGPFHSQLALALPLVIKKISFVMMKPSGNERIATVLLRTLTATPKTSLGDINTMISDFAGRRPQQC
jgi:hypothetical protein